ncbi:hypothetical protein [Agromyces bauzanensis]|uniref:Uncharacterized protein n=1 Tax=Agromyces bauzanensis TaxID=1308924 RepID=A0A917PGE4_9MICO|nr:hypothetical protein [Agromyces bauzanensis]GGJ76751.1 hypothetical protein GCM10011372_13770 [Agromyces bauzanensis]
MADTKQTKTVGEHWAASELARRGWAPALTRDGLERADILAVHTGDERRLIEVQVKSIRGDSAKSSWPLGEKSQQPPKHAHEWFVMVAVPDDVAKPMRGFVIPRAHVAAAAWIGHQHWFTEPGIPPGKRNVGPDRSRVQIRTFERYEGRWDLLDASADEAPILLLLEYRGYALEEDRVGLPAGHPWRENMPAPW